MISAHELTMRYGPILVIAKTDLDRIFPPLDELFEKKVADEKDK